MNTIHRPTLNSAQRIYERRLALRQAALLAKAYKMRDDQHDLERVAHWMTDKTPWDLPQECPRECVDGSQTHFDASAGSGQHPQDQNASGGQWHGHTYAQIAYSALVLMGAGLLCLLGGVALGAWIALERFGL